ncbi:MAG: hypothetical protein FGM46_00755 [Ferruginibacter sp.]|nr:hypothetical protein [Ferruginibacter sp.]
MRLFTTLLLIILISCKDNRNIPDVSHININVTTKRFEKDLFSMDTTQMQSQFDALEAKEPNFLNIFLYNILGADPLALREENISYLKDQFIVPYRMIFDSSQKIFSDFTPYEKEIKKSLQFVKYYFPDYDIPHTIVTYIGPLDGTGDAIANDTIIVGLQHHLGKDFKEYKSVEVSRYYPSYITKTFEPDYISINCIKNILGDIKLKYTKESKQNRSLICDMVEKGKELFILEQLLPYTDKNKLMGYDENQFLFCQKKEVGIWDFFIQNNMLQEKDVNIKRNYIGESPKTEEFGEDAPGNIGSFVGWQIVKKYMNENPSVSLKDLLVTDAEIIFEKAKYKP